MADLELGGRVVHVIGPAAPVFRVAPSDTGVVHVVPVPGPRGHDGDAIIPDVIDGGTPYDTTGA